MKVAATVGLRNAATAEFLLTPDGEFWFLEVNARLQVEHGVTELVADLDLVHEQLWIAAGRPMSARARAAAGRAATPERHAIEVTHFAPSIPACDFAPAPGRGHALASAIGPRRARRRRRGGGERLVSEHYDPLVAKIMVVAEDRPAAIARMRRALDDLEVGGIQTTLPFDRWLLHQPDFAAATGLSTDLVDRLWQPIELVSVAALRAAELAAVAAASAASTVRSRTSGWTRSRGRLVVARRHPRSHGAAQP